MRVSIKCNGNMKREYLKSCDFNLAFGNTNRWCRVTMPFSKSVCRYEGIKVKLNWEQSIKDYEMRSMCQQSDPVN